MNSIFFIAITSLTFATTTGGDLGWVTALKEFGFPVLVAVALWLRLERYQAEDRSDRKESEAARLAVLTQMKTSLEKAHEASTQIAINSLQERHATTIALRELKEQIKVSAPCLEINLSEDDE